MFIFSRAEGVEKMLVFIRETHTTRTALKPSHHCPRVMLNTIKNLFPVTDGGGVFRHARPAEHGTAPATAGLREEIMLLVLSWFLMLILSHLYIHPYQSPSPRYIFKIAQWPVSICCSKMCTVLYSVLYCICRLLTTFEIKPQESPRCAGWGQARHEMRVRP